MDNKKQLIPDFTSEALAKKVANCPVPTNQIKVIARFDKTDDAVQMTINESGINLLLFEQGSNEPQKEEQLSWDGCVELISRSTNLEDRLRAGISRLRDALMYAASACSCGGNGCQKCQIYRDRVREVDTQL